jgi:hypothetical protein
MGAVDELDSWRAQAQFPSIPSQEIWGAGCRNIAVYQVLGWQGS